MSEAASKAKLRLLLVLAHPDDEVWGCGGLMILNRQRGIHSTLICATKGEAGEISSPDLADASNLGWVREQELRQAAEYMCVDDLYFLGYRDSGMAGTAENQHPNAYANAPDSAVVARLVRFIRSIRPQVVITFDPTGGYGHPDHLAAHRHTVAAFHAAADPAHAPALGEAWQAQRLLFMAFDREAFLELREQMIAQGIELPWGNDDETNEGEANEGESSEPEFPQQPIHAIIDVSAVAAPKLKAFKSHRTQFGDDNPFFKIPEEFMLKMLSNESFEQAWPDTKPDQPVTDLFADLVN